VKKEITFDKKIFFLIIMLLLLFCVIANHKKYRTGDEVITYSMANSDFDGWMLPEGKTAKYLRERVHGENFFHTCKNVCCVVLDVAKNRMNAEYFTLPDVETPIWISGDEVRGWFDLNATGRDNRRFNYMSVYYGGLIDADNPCLYPALVHTVASAFYQYSNSNWCAYVVNIISMVVVLYSIVKICKLCRITRLHTIWILCMYGTMYGTLEMVANKRAYCLLTAFVMMLTYIHIKILDKLENNECVKKEWLGLVLLNAGGIAAQYLYAVVAFCFFICTAVIMMKRKCQNSYLWRYIFTMASGILLGAIFSPMFLKGVVTRFGTNSVEKIKVGWFTLFKEALVSFLKQWSNAGILIAGIGIVVIILGIQNRKELNCNLKILMQFSITYLLIEFLLVREFDRYLWCILPILAIVFGEIFLQGLNIESSRNSYIIAGVVSVIAITNICSLWTQMNIYNAREAEKHRIMEQKLNSNCIFVHNYASGYADLPMLQYFDWNMNYEVGTTKLEEQLGDERIGDSVIVHFSNTCSDYELITELLKRKRLTEVSLLYEDGKTMIYEYRK